MFKITICCVLAACLFDFAQSMGGNMIDYGIWEVKQVSECENPEQYNFMVNVEQHKCSRKTGCFDAWLNFKKQLNDNYGVKMDICKWVDGGCKHYQTMTDGSVVDFILKYAEGNFNSIFKIMDPEPDLKEFPIETGEYKCEKYLIDYCEFPCKSVLGLFDAEVTILDKDNNVEACIRVTVEFREPEGDEELCEKCQEEQ